MDRIREKSPLKPPKLKNLDCLEVTIKKDHQQTSTNIISLRENVENFNFISLTSIEKLETLINCFILEEIAKSDLSKNINLSNLKVDRLLNEINFFSKTSSYLTGFLSSDFSEKDKETWNEIEQTLSKIYNVDDGFIKKSQDYFLFKISSDQLANLIGKTSISFEEELFIRSILVKGYLNNLRQLILPFYQISDDILVKFKRKRIEELQPLSEDSKVSEEISLLNQQIDVLEAQSMDFYSKRENSKKSFNVSVENITAYNTQLNTGSVILGTTETFRYLTSSIGHKANLNILKSAGNFGLKTGSFITKFLPVVSVITEAGTQMGNNYVVYNYEKKLKILDLVETVKRNLLVLEQQVTDYYINSILKRLQDSFISSQFKTSQLISKAYNRFLAEKESKVIESQIELVRKEYYENVDVVRKSVKNNYRAKIGEKDEEINERDQRLSALDEQLTELNLQIEQKKKELNREIISKKWETEKLNNAVETVRKDLIINKELLKKEQESLRRREQALRESFKGNHNASLQAAYDYEHEKRTEIEATLNIVLKKQSELTESLNDSKTSLIAKEAELASEKDYWKAINEKVTNERNIYKKEKWELASKYRENCNKITIIEADLIILEAAKEELKKSINLEIEKCNRYRVEIKELRIKLVKFEENCLEIKQLKEKNNFLNLVNFNLEKKIKENIFLIKKLREDLFKEEANKLDFEKLKKEAFLTKIKLSSILVVDASRNFLPNNINDYITKAETVLLASELHPSVNKVSWLLFFFFFVFSIICGIFKAFSMMRSLLLKITSFFKEKKKIQKKVKVK